MDDPHTNDPRYDETVEITPELSSAPSSSDEFPETEFEIAQRNSLIQELRETVDKLERDHASRGDLKILSRSLKELRYAFKVFSRYRHCRKVTVFGSARTPADHPAYLHSQEFGRVMAEAGWMVLTGAGSGIMEGAHVGAGTAMSMGVNILLPFEQEANSIILNDEKLIHLKYFFTRKLLFVKEVHAVVVFPGGFGTQDEAFETLTLVQTGKRDLMPIVFIDEPGGTYWSGWQTYVDEHLLQTGMISPPDTSLYRITSNISEAAEEISQFYRVYHSMRYLHDRLVLRLNSEPNDDVLRTLNNEFGDLLESGTIERATAHRFEADDREAADLPRIAFHFDRRHVGRLRQLIDTLNREM
ncbi:MAG: TIGR00730 family Rossman fold protein [Planctomycetota bacterium]|nr:TIGR00730 family Rossman fold protein [Planctomycetota bacterium]MDA1211257.1 TIGR00730 family Rossman fold protein [Planctomycetota bacterium]